MTAPSLPFMSFAVADFLAETAAFTAAEAGIAIRLLCHAWRIGRALPVDDTILARLAGVELFEFRNAWPSVQQMFERSESGWIRPALIEERDRALQVRSSRQKAQLLSVAARLAKDGAQQITEQVTEPDALQCDPPMAVQGAQVLPFSLSSDFSSDVDVSPGEKRAEARPAGKTKSSERKSRGTTIPEDFEQTPGLREIAAQEGLAPEWVVREFCSYWRGSGGLKGNWVETFRNSCIKQAERIPGRRPSQGEGTAAAGRQWAERGQNAAR